MKIKISRKLIQAKTVLLAGALAISALLAGCSTTQQGALIGAGAGGLTGGIIGHQSGHTGTGAAIGAGAGALGGALIGEQAAQFYCPECGKRFAGAKQYCPYDGAPLRRIQRH